MAIKSTHRSVSTTLKVFLFAITLLPISVWANVPAEKLFNSSYLESELTGPFMVSDLDRFGPSFKTAQYTDHTMRFERGGSPSSNQNSVVDAPQTSQPASSSQGSSSSSSSSSSSGSSSTQKSTAPQPSGVSSNISSQATPVDSYGSIDGINQVYEEGDPFTDQEEVVPELKDPFFSFNRTMHNFNEALYDAVLEPVVEFYVEYIHEDVRIAIRNLFRNALSPARFVNSLLQGKFEKAGRVLSRTVLNTVFGWGGMLDVAGQEYNIKPVNEDFGQTLGFYGVPSGPYIVLPFLGPSTARDVTGRVVDSFMSPTIVMSPGLIGGFAMQGSQMINEASFNLEGKRQLEAGAIDQYESIRDFYHQYREGLVKK
ncbi:MAG: MlaA family lipoprotein [Nitrospinales bacterium]